MNPFFNRVDIFTVIEHQKQELKKTFQSVTNTEIDADPVAVVARLIEQFSINVPVLDEEKKYALTKETPVDVSRDPRRHILNRSRPFYIAGTEVTIVVPFYGDAGLFNVQPTMFTSNPPFGEIHGNELHLIYKLTDPGFDVEGAANRTISQIKQYLRSLHDSAEQLKSDLQQLVNSLMHKRKQERGIHSQIIAGLSIPVKQVAPMPPANLPTSSVTPVTRNKSTKKQEDEWDVFISHASEDKEAIARPLADALQSKGLRVWYDDFSLQLGDSLRRSIDRGLSQSRYGVVVLSHNFFKKDWPQKELDGLVALEVGGRKVILPIWHGIRYQEVAQYSPTLADRLAVSSSAGMDKVVDAIVQALTASTSRSNRQRVPQEAKGSPQVEFKQVSQPEHLQSEPISKGTPVDKGRRDVIGVLTKVGIIATVSNLGWKLFFDCRDYAEKIEQQRLERDALLRQEASAWLQRYCFPLKSVEDLKDSAARVALLAGIDDRYDPISPLKFSESGSRVSARYIDAFQTGIAERIERVQGTDDLREDDALVLVGSHEVNPKAREYFGQPEKHVPVHRVTVGRTNEAHYEAELEWAIFTPEDARDVHILQTRENKPVPLERKTKEHVISCADGPPLRSEPGKSGTRDIWLTDYLLITSLPTDVTERRRVISFAGLHRTGTLAAGKLFSDLPHDILRQIHETLGGDPYFQALVSLKVDNTQSERGSASPGQFIGVQVSPLKIQKFKSSGE